MLLDRDESQLVLVDFQVRLMPAIHEQAHVLANAVRLARMASLLKLPVIATEENAQSLGPTVPALSDVLVETRAQVMPKRSFSAVADGLVDRLRTPVPGRAPSGNARSLPRHLQKTATPVAQRGSIVMAGCEAHVCLLQTALDLLDDDFDVWVVTDACGSRTERNRDAALDRLAGAGAELVTTEMVAFEWLRSVDHPAFKQFLSLVK